APMQGTAADIIKTAMIAVDAWLAESGLDARMIMQVHDELVLEVAEDQVEAVTEPLREFMSSAAALKVPLLVEVGVGSNWDEAHWTADVTGSPKNSTLDVNYSSQPAVTVLCVLCAWANSSP